MPRPRKTPPNVAARIAYRPDEAAAALGLSRQVIMRLIREGQLTAVKVPGARERGAVLIPKASLDAFLAANPWAEAAL